MSIRLIIPSAYARDRATYEPLFSEACRIRDARRRNIPLQVEAVCALKSALADINDEAGMRLADAVLEALSARSPVMIKYVEFGHEFEEPETVVRAQALVEHLYEKFEHSEAVFADPINAMSVQRALNVDFPTVLEPQADGETDTRRASPERVAALLESVEAAELRLPDAEALRASRFAVDAVNSIEGWHDLLRHRESRMRAFLRRAVESGEALEVA